MDIYNDGLDIEMDNGLALLQVENVGYIIDGKTILKDVKFNLAVGEFKLITGPSGCGKSTLLKIIASLLSPSSGRILYKQSDYTTISPEEYRKQVSYCTQTPTLFGSTVYDNLIFPYQLRNISFDKNNVLKDLEYFSLPETILEKNINELSGGEKQRISLIRNLQFLPSVLLLDEITSALDEDNKTKVNDLIHQLATQKNISILWVTHDQGEISHADDIITLPICQNIK